jgi:TRAP-type C4-dicarboxylate transport system permease small subunit
MAPLRYLRAVCAIVGCLALAGMVVLPGLQIILRELGRPIVGLEELTRYLLIVVTFIGIPLVTHERTQIRMDDLHKLMPARVAGWLRVVIAAVSGASLALVVLAIWSSIQLTIGSSTPSLGIPFWLFNQIGRASCRERVS